MQTFGSVFKLIIHKTNCASSSFYIYVCVCVCYHLQLLHPQLFSALERDSLFFGLLQRVVPHRGAQTDHNIHPAVRDTDGADYVKSKPFKLTGCSRNVLDRNRNRKQRQGEESKNAGVLSVFLSLTSSWCLDTSAERPLYTPSWTCRRIWSPSFGSENRRNASVDVAHIKRLCRKT